MNMSDRIRILRISKGVTQETLGEVIGVQRSAIRKYESGTVENIPRSSIKKMADYFGVSPSYLMGWEEETPSIELSDEERKLLDLFRLVPEDKQQMLFQMIQVALGKI